MLVTGNGNKLGLLDIFLLYFFLRKRTVVSNFIIKIGGGETKIKAGVPKKVSAV